MNQRKGNIVLSMLSYGIDILIVNDVAVEQYIYIIELREVSWLYGH